MSKGPSPLLGFNNNVRHKGRVFHIQTEDSGIRHPHVITHLFMDGGRIVKTTKTSYREHLGSEKLAEVVRDLMKQQHKAMFVALRDGEYDELIARKSAGSGEIPVVEAEERKTIAREPLASLPDDTAAGPPPPPPSTLPTPHEVEVELAAIARAAAAAASSPTDGRISTIPEMHGDLPPPPASLLQKPKGEGTYREVSTAQRRSRPPPRPGGSQQPVSGKYSVSRPSPTSQAFTGGRPPEGRSIFGEDLISEKSLDEVILSYLAEDLDASPSSKK